MNLEKVPLQPLTDVKILIADDNESMRDLLHHTINQWGYEVVEASNGEEAWKIMQQPDAPELLILDWVMPKLDGLALCKRIRQELNFYPYIIFLTQMSGATNMLKGLEAGADEFLLKPVNFNELRDRVFSGGRIIKYLKIIQEQKKQLKERASYIKLLEQIITTLGSKM